MHNTTIHDVAAYIVRYFGKPISAMKLQKLAYFSQGWSLALLEKPLFKAEFQAWRHGPVNRDLFSRHKGQFHVSSWIGDPENLGELEKLVVDGVLTNYGALSGTDLSELTHMPDSPWTFTREQAGVRPRASSDVVIDEELMKKHFRRQLEESSKIA